MPMDRREFIQIMGAAGLALAGIDLRRGRDGETYCFEVNPLPGFHFYERHSGQPISEAVAALLCGLTRPKQSL